MGATVHAIEHATEHVARHPLKQFQVNLAPDIEKRGRAHPIITLFCEHFLVMAHVSIVID